MNSRSRYTWTSKLNYVFLWIVYMFFVILLIILLLHFLVLFFPVFSLCASVCRIRTKLPHKHTPLRDVWKVLRNDEWHPGMRADGFGGVRSLIRGRSAGSVYCKKYRVRVYGGQKRMSLNNFLLLLRKWWMEHNNLIFRIKEALFFPSSCVSQYFHFFFVYAVMIVILVFLYSVSNIGFSYTEFRDPEIPRSKKLILEFRDCKLFHFVIILNWIFNRFLVKLFNSKEEDMLVAIYCFVEWILIWFIRVETSLDFEEQMF